ncbi:hypothetical protein CFH99_16700 [Nocardioides aromaticivorans]|uniref:Uncharacterized protein n=1 Tax=Nocardioides aromaticivorans TaxID=200618 RepID=A0ABX7PNG1_9ACTN|nr:hypothetical protein [Nocardioides aromaticivorans]QSR27262.1 hypothetical protein CFH99_16700 [Nocardioides aromaticivorans]
MTSTTTKIRTAPAKPVAKARTAKAAPTPKESPAKSVKPAKPEPTCLREALTMKQAVLVKERANKTIRSLPYLSPGSDARTEAEAVAALVAAGKTLPEIADERKVSLATARRFLTNLDLAKRVEAGEFDAMWKPGAKQITVHRVAPKPAR